MEDMVQLGLDWGLRTLSALIILIVGWMLGKFVQKRIQKAQNLDKTLSSFLGGFAKYSILAVALVTVLGQFGIQTASFLAVLGAAGLAIGLALQGTLSNVAAGMMLLLLRPFNVGDYIQYGSTGGTVKALNLFGTELATPDNVFIYAPNKDIWNSTIFNYSRHDTRRHDFVFGISYSDSIDTAFEIINGLIEQEDRILRDEGIEPMIMVDEMAQSSINIRVRVWCKAADYWDLKWDMTRGIKESLDTGGITIPFPTRTIEIVGDDKTSASKAA